MYKTAHLIQTIYFGRLFQDHFTLNQYLSKWFPVSCPVYQYGCFDMQPAYVLG